MTDSRIIVLHVITGLSTGGAEMMLYKLLSGIDKEKFQCQVISLTDEGTVGPKIKTLGIQVQCLGMRHGWPDPVRLFKLVKILRVARPDIVQTWLYHADFIGGLAAKLAGLEKVVWNIRHNNLDAKLNKFHTRITVSICALLSGCLAKSIICNSQASSVIHQSIGYEKTLFRYIGNGFNLQHFVIDENANTELKKLLDISNNALLIGLVARFDSLKDHHNFIHAAGLVLNENRQIHFVLIGTSVTEQNEDLMQWIKATGYREHFHLLGERENIPELTAGLDIACSSSLGESFPNAIGEAMACAVPCVVTDVGDSAYLVAATGLVVPAADAQALANAIIQLISEGAERRAKRGREARLRIEQNFALPVIVKQYELLYRDLVAQNNPAEPRTI